MITSTTLIWVGTMALLTLLYGLRTAVPQIQAGEVSLEGIIAYASSLVFWLLFSLHSSGYIQTIGSGVVNQVNTFSFAVIGLIMAFLCLILLFDASMRVIG